MLVPTIRTTCTTQELCKAIMEGWYNLFGAILPSKSTVGIFISQIGLETGGQYNQWNWNLGNIKYVSSNGDEPYIALNGVWEIINGQKVMIPVTDPGAWFRSFPTLNDGITFYLNFLKNGRYSQAFIAATQGDLSAFAHQLRIAGYYTASEESYLNGMMGYYNLYNNSGNYENAIAEFHGNVINFPPDYQPVDLTQSNSNNTVITVPANTGWTSSLLLKFKSMLNIGN